MSRTSLRAAALTVTTMCLAWAAAGLEAAAAEQTATGNLEVFVAPGGKDTNPGTAKEPFATLTAARDAVRQRIAAGLKQNVTVRIHAGTYTQAETLRFGPQDSGTDEHSVTYAAMPGEEVVLSGGRKIAGWKRAQGQIWTAELPEVKAGAWHFRQLFVNGRRAIRARTPNADDKAPWCSIRSVTVKPGAPEPSQATLTLSVTQPVRAWKNVSDVEFVWINNNDGSRRRLGAVNAAEQTFTLPPPHLWPPKSLPGEYQIALPAATQAGYFENALEMLDQPGEWYLDRQTGILSYWPRAGEDLQRAEVVAPVVQKTLLAVTGTAERPVRNLHFQGIRVAHVDWPLPPHGFTAMFGCLQWISGNQPEPWVKFHWIDAAVQFQYARSCSFTGGAVEHAGGIGVGLLRGSSGIVVEGNRIHDLGGGGVVAGGIRNRDTLKWADPVDKEEYRDFRIANNRIHDCGADYFGSIGVFVGITQHAVVAHNLIHDISYSGIVLSGNEDKTLPFAGDNAVEYNHIHHVMKTAVDGAGIYVSFPQARSGAAIRGNLIHELRHNPFNSRPQGPWSSPGIYLDAVRQEYGCRGYHFEKNVVYRTGTPLFFCQCGKEGNVWLDNVFQTDGDPPREVLEAIEAKAGLEPAFRRLLLDTSKAPDPAK
jgi:hypothetical protein